jgi:Ca-activated chloride channel homolog
MLSVSLPAQYYLTGEVQGSHGDKLQNVTITVLSTGASFLTGSLGEFRIVSRTADDTLTFAAEGFETYTTEIHTTGFLQVTLRMIPLPAGSKEGRLSSMVRIVRSSDSGTAIGGSGGPSAAATSITGPLVAGSSLTGAFAAGSSLTGALAAGSSGTAINGIRRRKGPGVLEASYNSRVENPFVRQPATVSFKGAIPRASYSTIRRFLHMGSAVPPDAVKIEEMLNYFNFYYEEPEGSKVFHCSSELLSCPWNEKHRLLFLRVSARKVNIATKPPSNLVLLIDASGSMDMPNKLPLIKSGIRLLVDNLRDIDMVSLVQYGGDTRIVFAGIPGSEKGKIMKAVERLRADGPSPGLDGIRLAYDVARHQFIPGGNNRVILITDGDVSTRTGSLAEQTELEELVDKQLQTGIHLTCGGLGMRTYKDSKLPLLAEIGRGNFAYLDDEEEAEQLLAGELDQNLGCVADNVSITADFNPLLVGGYRLIGFDNKRSALEDTASELEGGRTGSGQSLLALFEVEPKTDSTGADTIARIRINYCLPGTHARQTMSYACMNDPQLFDKGKIELKRAACIAMFGMKLQHSDYAAKIGWQDIEKIAKKTFTGGNYLDDEYISLIDEARKIYEGQ